MKQGQSRPIAGSSIDNGGIDQFALSRAEVYDDKRTEVSVDTPDVLQAMIAVSPVSAKQNEEETNERS
jgi:hypothetical protein